MKESCIYSEIVYKSNSFYFGLGDTMITLLADELPYEKLKRYGAEALDQVELLAILLRTGTKDKSPLDLAREVLKKSGGFRGLSQMTLTELQKIKGIGEVKAIQIKALAEIAKRFQQEVGVTRYTIDSPRSVAEYYMDEMSSYTQEHFKVILLNTKNEIIRDKNLFIGTANNTLVSPKIVFEFALKNSAVSVIFMHNHPSGDVEPSYEDITLTKRCHQAAKIMDINLLDHIIIGNRKFTSMKQRNLF